MGLRTGLAGAPRARRRVGPRTGLAGAPRARRRVGPRTGLAGAAAVAAAGAFLALPGPAGPNLVAAAYDALHQPGTILHYEQRWTAPGSGVAPRQVLRMSPHPGARIVDGEAVDAAEARHERRSQLAL